MNEDKTKFLNKYTATLTYDGKAVPGQRVNFAWHHREDEAYKKSADPRIDGAIVPAVTDAQGRAQLDLSELDRYTGIYHDYRLAACFDPEPGEPWFNPAKSDVYAAYCVTVTSDELDS